MKYVQTVRRSGKANYYFRSPTGFRTPLPNAGPESDDFKEAHGRLMALVEEERSRANASKQGAALVAKAGAMQRAYLKAAQKARHRARVMGVDCDITDACILRLAAIQGDKCALTGIAFRLDKSERGVKRPFAPSLDRIETGAGYVGGNVRLVCQIANYARLDFSDAEFYELCRAGSKYAARE